MIRMTDRARERVEAYLDRVRRALSGHPDVDADEVATDVRAHIEEALSGRPEPVGEDDVVEVLERLGAPGRWAPAEEVGGWRALLTRIRRGPDDWRLAYLCFALTFVGILTAPFGGFLLLVPAFVLARGAWALSEERGEAVGSKRWLVYPALIVVYGLVVAVLIGWPIAASAPVFATGGLVDFLQESYDVAYPEPGTPAHWTRSLGWTLVGTGAWWSVLGGVAAVRPGWVRSVFRPFADRFRRALAWGPVVAGVVVALAGIVVLALA